MHILSQWSFCFFGQEDTNSYLRTHVWYMIYAQYTCSKWICLEKWYEHMKSWTNSPTVCCWVLNYMPQILRRRCSVGRLPGWNSKEDLLLDETVRRIYSCIHQPKPLFFFSTINERILWETCILPSEKNDSFKRQVFGCFFYSHLVPPLLLSSIFFCSFSNTLITVLIFSSFVGDSFLLFPFTGREVKS